MHFSFFEFLLKYAIQLTYYFNYSSWARLIHNDWSWLKIQRIDYFIKTEQLWARNLVQALTGHVCSVESVQVSNLSSYTFNSRAYPGGFYNDKYANMISPTSRHPWYLNILIAYKVHLISCHRCAWEKWLSWGKGLDQSLFIDPCFDLGL